MQGTSLVDDLNDLPGLYRGGSSGEARKAGILFVPFVFIWASTKAFAWGKKSVLCSKGKQKTPDHLIVSLLMPL